ncbi:unnamed protein product [Amoebophrya sp. A25]|nr:unnamed protein product [Amoebophrya sp. A25]|eukprot:GSA25T00007005001.1
MYHALVTSMMLARFSVVIAACMVSTASADSAATDHPGSTSTLLQLEEVSKRRGEQEGQDHGEEFLEDIDSPVFKKVERTETSRRSGLSRDRGRAHGTTLQLLLQQNDKKIDHELTILGLGWIAYVSLVCALGCLGGCCHGFFLSYKQTKLSSVPAHLSPVRGRAGGDAGTASSSREFFSRRTA